jgi:hypothetical protein
VTSPRKKKTTTEHVQLRKIDLALDLSSAGAREALASLKGALEGATSSGPVQLRLDACDLSSIYLYLSQKETKSLVARLIALVELGQVG